MALADHRTKSASLSFSPVRDIRRHTAVGKNAIDNFVNFFQGNLVSPNMPWLSLRYESSDLTDQDDMSGANEYLGKVQEAISSELSCSNFYPEHRMATKDKYVSACSAMLVINDPDRNICCFNTLAPWDYWIDTDQYGEVDTLFYKKTMSLDKAYEMFGDKCPKWIVDAVREGDPYQSYHDFLLCIYPRKKIYSSARSIFPKEKKFAVVWMYLSSGLSTSADSGKSEIIDESGTDFFPAIVGTWDRDGDNPYGTCPVIRNISELKRLDALSYETMLSVQKINHPAYAGVASSLEGFSDDPGARNKVNSMDMIPQVIGSQQTIDGALELQRSQESAIEKMFNNDMFNYFGREENNKAYTATQVNAVKGEQLSLMSAVYGNFQKEVEQTIKLVIAIMAENKRLPKGAKKLVTKNKGKIRVVIDSTMAQELRAYTNRDANIALLEQAGILMQIAPESLMNYNFDEIARGIAQGYGVKYTVLKDKMAVAMEKAYQMQLQQAQMMQQAELNQSQIDRNEAGAANLNNAGGSNQYRRA